MPSFYLVPTTQQTINGQTFTAPEYPNDLAGVDFNVIPFGVEPLALVILPAPNSALGAETDVYAFPTDLTQLLQDSDVVTLGAYLANLNIPSSFILAGANFQSVVRTLAQIALALQFAEGPQGTNGASVFVQTPNLGTGKLGTGLSGVGSSPSNPSAALQALPAGVFDFTQVDPTAAVEDSLVLVSQQFDSPILIGQGAI